LLSEALGGVELGAYDRAVLDWLAGQGSSTVVVVASLIQRARACERDEDDWLAAFDATELEQWAAGLVAGHATQAAPGERSWLMPVFGVTHCEVCGEEFPCSAGRDSEPC